jgi:probable phosphoglycerate mutase
MELVLVRHAQPERIEEGEVEGPADPGLTHRGRREAERLAAWLAYEHIDHVLASPLRRARETAAPLASALGLDVEVDDGLTEYDAAATSYIPIEELRELKDERWHATIEGRWEDVGGESPHDFQQRVVPVVEGVIERFPGQKVVAVSHGGFINVYLAHILGMTHNLLWFHPGYTSISRVHAAREGTRSVGSINELAHLVAHRDPMGDPIGQEVGQ